MKKLLIVDDQRLYSMSLEVALKRDYIIKIAESYQQAISICEEGVDIALIDIRLDEEDQNNTDGLKILEWIRKNRPDIPVFMMSAYREFNYAETALNLGAKHFFRKPIKIEELQQILKEKI